MMPSPLPLAVTTHRGSYNNGELEGRVLVCNYSTLRLLFSCPAGKGRGNNEVLM